MSMMVNPVSSVSFRANSTQLPDDFLSRPGAYSMPAQEAPVQQQPKKKHTALKTIAGLVVAAAVIAGGLYFAHKNYGEIFNEGKKYADIKNIEDFMPRMKEYITTTIGKGGEKVEKGFNAIAETCTKYWNKIFNKAETSAS